MKKVLMMMAIVFATMEMEAKAADLDSNIVKHEYITPTGVVVVVENNNDVDVELDANVIYYDENGIMIGADDRTLYEIGKHGKGAIAFASPLDAEYHGLKIGSFATSYKAEKARGEEITNYQADISIVSNAANGAVTAQFVNNSGIDFGYVQACCVFFKEGICQGVNKESFEIANGMLHGIKFDSPYDYNYKHLDFDSYEIIINETSLF